FFGWAQYGLLRMRDRTIPAGTVIDTEAQTVDPRRLEEIVFSPQPDNRFDRYLTLVAGYAVDPAVSALASRWGSGISAGWPQVEAVVALLRRHYTHDRGVACPADCRDVVAHFLLTSRRGPDYQFATAAAVILRLLGYPTRVVGGLYADPAR